MIVVFLKWTSSYLLLFVCRVGWQTMQWAHDLRVWLQGTSLKNCATLIPSGMLRVGWSCLALPAFSTSRFNLASILHMFTMLWHDSVAIFWDDDEVIVMVTREFCNRMTYFFICSQLRVHFQTWWWCHRPILWYIKMILAKLGVKEREKANSLKFCSYIQWHF